MLRRGEAGRSDDAQTDCDLAQTPADRASETIRSKLWSSGVYCEFENEQCKSLGQSFGAESSVNITMTQIMKPYKAKVGNSGSINTKTAENALRIRITGLKTAAMLKRD